MKKLFILVLFLPFFGVAQWTYNSPYFLSSSNGEYFLKSIPHQPQRFEDLGYTEVFRTKDSISQYRIDYYLNSKNIILSDDGQGLLFKPDVYYMNSPLREYNLYFFREGQLKKKIPLTEVVLDSVNYISPYFFYRNRDLYEFHSDEKIYHEGVPSVLKKAIESPMFVKGNTAYLSIIDSSLILIDLKNGEILQKANLLESADILDENFNLKDIYFPDVKNPGEGSIPYLGDSVSLISLIENNFDLQADYSEKRAVFKYYRLEIECVIDYMGNCLEIRVDCEDSALIPEIKNIFINLKYDSTKIPKIYEKWEFDGYETFRKNNDSVARAEKNIERQEEFQELQWRRKQDSLNGVYIPKDIEDCFIELDKMFTPKNKEELKNSSPNAYHFGLGTWLRNNWGLWKGSRLHLYFEKKGVTHPDNMSGIILNSYFHLLNHETIDLNKIFDKYYLTPIPKLPYPSRIKDNLIPQKL
ncbi:MAG: hypothetical protein GQ527_00460 [Bacteroidales bacterium]|nr:hypothetical protein [Bacteroidales bacterium]